MVLPTQIQTELNQKYWGICLSTTLPRAGLSVTEHLEATIGNFGLHSPPPHTQPHFPLHLAEFGISQLVSCSECSAWPPITAPIPLQNTGLK